MKRSQSRLRGCLQCSSLRKFLACSTLSLGILATLLSAPALAARLPNNRIVFDRSPELIEASVLSARQAREGKFQIVIDVPANAGEPLEAVVVHSRQAGASFPFNPGATEAYLGKPEAGLAAISLASVGGMMMSPDEVLVVFATPIEPGNQVTIILQSKYPPVPGIYEFGVTAYPSGDIPVGQFLGYEEIQF